MSVTTFVIVIGVLAAICLTWFVALVRSDQLASKAIKTAKDSLRIAKDAQSVARRWQDVAERLQNATGERAVAEAARRRRRAAR